MTTKTPSLKLTEKFLKGLKEYGDIKIWKYCGGDRGRHLNYFRIACKNEKLPEHEDNCVCGHDIVENCYINCYLKEFVIWTCFDTNSL